MVNGDKLGEIEKVYAGDVDFYKLKAQLPIFQTVLTQWVNMQGERKPEDVHLTIRNRMCPHLLGRPPTFKTVLQAVKVHCRSFMIKNVLFTDNIFVISIFYLCESIR